MNTLKQTTFFALVSLFFWAYSSHLYPAEEQASLHCSCKLIFQELESGPKQLDQQDLAMCMLEFLTPLSCCLMQHIPSDTNDQEYRLLSPAAAFCALLYAHVEATILLCIYTSENTQLFDDLKKNIKAKGDEPPAILHTFDHYAREHIEMLYEWVYWLLHLSRDKLDELLKKKKECERTGESCQTLVSQLVNHYYQHRQVGEIYQELTPLIRELRKDEA